MTIEELEQKKQKCLFELNSLEHDPKREIELIAQIDTYESIIENKKAKAKAKHITESIYDNGFENAVKRIIKGEW